jgi:hypothetical protein
MTTRTSVAPSIGMFAALALAAFGAVPWALGRVIGATLWLLGWR